MKHLEDTPRWICDTEDTNYCAYMDTDSVYISAEPLLLHLYPDFEDKSDKEKDEFILKKSRIISPEIKSLSKDTSDMISSLPFDTNINMDTSNMYDEDLIDEDSSQIFIVNRPYVVKG